MAALSAQLKRSFVTWLLLQVNAGKSVSLQKAIESYLTAQVDAISKGQIITSVSGNGYSSTFSGPNPGLLAGFSAPEIAAFAQELLEIYEISKREVANSLRYGLEISTVNVTGWPSLLPDPVMSDADAQLAATDDLVAAQMKWMLATVTECRGDYRDVRFAQGGVLVQ